MKAVKISFLVFCIISIIFAVHAYINNTGWLFDQFLGITIMLIFLKFYRPLKLRFYTYTLLALALLVHHAGTFGFYNISPLPIQYDHITHILGLFAFTLAIFNLLKYKISNTVELIFITLLVGSGFGAFIEVYEFVGHLFRSNLFFNLFSGLILDKTDQGREWVNSMIDLLYNSIGCILAITFAKIKENYGLIHLTSQ